MAGDVSVRIRGKKYAVAADSGDSFLGKGSSRLFSVTEMKGRPDEVLLWRHGFDFGGAEEVFARRGAIRGGRIAEIKDEKPAVWASKWDSGEWHFNVEKGERGKGYGKMLERVAAALERDRPVSAKERERAAKIASEKGISVRDAERWVRLRRPLVVIDWAGRARRARGDKVPVRGLDKFTKGFVKSGVIVEKGGVKSRVPLYHRHGIYTMAAAAGDVMKRDIGAAPRVFWFGDAGRKLTRNRAGRLSGTSGRRGR